MIITRKTHKGIPLGRNQQDTSMKLNYPTTVKYIK